MQFLLVTYGGDWLDKGSEEFTYGFVPNTLAASSTFSTSRFTLCISKPHSSFQA